MTRRAVGPATIQIAPTPGRSSENARAGRDGKCWKRPDEYTDYVIDPDPNTEALLRRATADPEAADALFAAHREGLRRMIGLRVDAGLRRRLDASDVVQDALLTASKRLADYVENRPMPFVVWLRVLTRQALVGQYRRHLGADERDPKREVSGWLSDRTSADVGIVADRLAKTAVSPEDQVAREEIRKQLVLALESLEHLDREVLVMRHFEQLTNVQTAAELGIDTSAASKRHLRALERLRRVMHRSSDQG